MKHYSYESLRFIRHWRTRANFRYKTARYCCSGIGITFLGACKIKIVTIFKHASLALLSAKPRFTFFYKRQLAFFQILTEKGSFGNGFGLRDAAFIKEVRL